MEDTKFHCDDIDISIIIPVHNGEPWINRCFNSILKQTAIEKNIKLEVSVFNDASNDNTESILNTWFPILTIKGIYFVLTVNSSGSPKGVGYAKNAAVRASHGEYLCFQDIDDVMLPDRLIKQYKECQSNKNSIVGCKFSREPPSSTERFTNWGNNLTQYQLNTQIYTSNGPTVIMPTWFLHRDIYNRVGGFCEETKGYPEDLLFFYQHIDAGGTIHRVDEYLLIYTYHLKSATFSVSSDLIWNIRMEHFRKNFLAHCGDGFTIWNGGKQGRKFLKSLNDQQRSLVKALCDVDIKKIGKYYELYCPTKRKVKNKIPIIHFRDAKPPLVICMKLDLTNGEFEKNLQSLNLAEGKDYILFS